MRLIDADKLYKHLNDWAFAEAPTDLDIGELKFEREVIYKTINDCMRAVDEQPTAYDVGEVMAELEGFKYAIIKHIAKSRHSAFDNTHIDIVDDAINIVKARR